MINWPLSNIKNLCDLECTGPGFFLMRAKGILTKKDFLTAHELNLLSLNRLEFGLEGPLTASLMERLKEGLSRLPEFSEAQFLLIRSANQADASQLFPSSGLKSRLILIEKNPSKANKAGPVLTMVQDLGMSPKPLHQRDLDKILARTLGAACEDGDQLPDLVWEGDHLRAGPDYLKVASLTDSPQSTWPGVLQGLADFNDELTLSIKIRIPDKKKTRREFETRRRVSHALSIHKANELSNMDSDSTLGAAEDVLTRMNIGKEPLAALSACVTMRDENLVRLETRMATLASDGSINAGAGLYVEEIGTLPVLKSHLPGQPMLPARELTMLTGNLAHCLPILMDYTREQTPGSLKFLSRSGEISHLNLFSPTNLNFNAFVCGASGSGKSFLMNSILASFMADFENGAISIFDVGGSYRKLVGHLGGKCLELSPATATSLIVESFRQERFKPSGYCKTLIEALCGAGTHISHSHRVAIEDLLQTCEGSPFKIKTLILEATDRKERAYADLAHWLKPFAAWDELKTTEIDKEVLDAKVRAFDFKNLESDPHLQRLAILVLTNRIWTEIKSKGATRTLVVFDEVWKFFAQASGFLEEMYRTFRKYGAGIASITQNLADYGDDAFARLVITNSFNRILLQGAAAAETLKATLDLSDCDVARFLSVASKKNHYSEFLLNTPKFSQVLRLYPSQKLFELANSELVQEVSA